MKRVHSRWWWLLAAVPVLVLMDVSTELLTRTGRIPQPLWIGTCVILALSLLLLVIVVSRQYDLAASEKQCGEDASDGPIS